MNVDQYGPVDGPDLVCLFGWGNQLHHTNVNWLIDQFVAAGYRVHAFEIPTVISDFEREYVAPVDAYLDDLESFRLVAHSAGGLIAAYLDGAETETYLSPFWGFRGGQVGLDGPLLALASLLPISRPVLPAGTSTRESIGELATDRELAEGASFAAPTWIREVRTAHRDLPPIPEDAVVFCTIADRVVGVHAIGEAVPADRTVLYDGGHELFSSRARDDHLDTLLDVVADGAGALEQ